MRKLRKFVVSVVGTVLPLTAAAQVNPVFERGKYLVEGPVACGNCHIPRGEKGAPIIERGLSGGMVFDEPAFKAFAPNITSDPETGIGKWTEAQIARAIREGIRPDGSVIGPPMSVPFYRSMSDADLTAIVTYIKALPPVKNVVPKSEYRIPLPPNYGPALKNVTAPPRTDRIRYGGYLVQISHCMECHSPFVKGQLMLAKMGAGGREFHGPWGVSVARNLTPDDTGLKQWTDAQIERAIREGVGRDGNRLKPPMAFGWYKNISAEDMSAMIAYLRTLKPHPFGG